ncbi:integrase arm-type DNA-binding domain-containing protein [Variovorax sp. RTB1]|uniref:tyrosine-type recombinase/integrase n=1 Tax=Variovorax sp. RTB1 TaxID=3048631 RepID=UPI002B228631|nr:integrase arm-type DNA-binding domain-containing protein [Variovorax sp. RTB1]MEB0112188.1 integrase arm-type DNA-binding domain-containing protein [Variovorax sp. RTB1]
MSLTDTAVRQAKPIEKARRLADALGLYVEISPAGGKWWRWKYRFGGKEKRLALGTYPEVSLAEARNERDKARALLKAGTDPSAARKLGKARSSISTEANFEGVAREWHTMKATGWAESHASTTIARLEKDVFPWIGKRPIREIDPPELLVVLRRVEERLAIETAHRLREICGQVFRYAISTDRATRNAAADLQGTLQTAASGHHAAITDPVQVAELVRNMRGYRGSPVVRTALQFSALTFQRPGEVRAATWSEIDLDAGLWTIPAARMKRGLKEKLNGQPHLVPLSTQAVKLLRELHPLTGHRGGDGCVFPGERGEGRPLSENGVRMALRTLGYDNETMTPHGFRAMARTILDEVLKERVEYIEAQLAHTVKDPLGRAYNRTTFLPERIAMMQRWADFLDALAQGVKLKAA